MTKCYIAGAITGLTKQQYEANFRSAEIAVSILGYEPVNPCTLHADCEHEKTWLGYLRCDISALITCDAVYALSNWKDSRGATIEVTLATGLGLKVIYQ